MHKRASLFSCDHLWNRTKTGTYPVKLPVTGNNVPKRHQTIFNLSKQDLNTISAKNMPAHLRNNFIAGQFTVHSLGISAYL